MAMHNEEDSGGYNYSFVEPLHNRYVCIICHLPSRDPQMTGECCRGQILCKSCLECARREIASSVHNTCVICRTQGFITYYPNFQLDREIRSLRIYCINREKGCKWQGELNNINDHLKLANSGCQFQEVECSNKCGELIERRHLATHTVTMCARRKVNCQYCHNHVTMHCQVWEQILHTEVCPKAPLPCPNKCGVKDIPREDMKKHKKECLFEVVVCANQCGIALERRKLSDHIKTECPRRKVNCQYCNYVGEYQLIEGRHKDKCPKFPLSCPNKCEVGTIPRDSMEKHKGECQLEVINCYNNCRRKLERRYLNNHVKNECPCRKVSCPHCHLIGEHQFVMGKHTELCPKFPLLCPNKCQIGTIPRENLKAHKDECPQ